jgi:hypothetical protein
LLEQVAGCRTAREHPEGVQLRVTNYQHPNYQHPNYQFYRLVIPVQTTMAPHPVMV